jgi:hypothetical protein
MGRFLQQVKVLKRLGAAAVDPWWGLGLLLLLLLLLLNPAVDPAVDPAAAAAAAVSSPVRWPASAAGSLVSCPLTDTTGWWTGVVRTCAT